MLRVLNLASGCAWCLLPLVFIVKKFAIGLPFLSLLEEETRKYRNEYHDLVRCLTVTNGRTRASGIEREIGAERTQWRDGIFGTRLAFRVTLEL